MTISKAVYHASRNLNVEEFQPRSASIRDPNEGAVVFATPSKALATMFMANTSDSWVTCGLQNRVPYIVISDRHRFEAGDHGGAIYTLPGDTFVADPSKGMGEMEVTSKSAVKPIAKQVYKSALAAMLEHGVQVYFVDKPTYKAINSSQDDGLSILQTLESENQRLGINIMSFVPGSRTWPA